MKVKEITPKSLFCVVGACPSIFENKKNYLIIGKLKNPKEYNLEKKVSKDEVLIEVPKELITNIKK